MSGLHWTNERRKLSELRPQPDNPRAIRKAEAARLNESLQQFDQFDTIAVGPDGTVYNGHQRVAVWTKEHGGDFEVDVRVASRALSHDEWRKLTALAHTGATGDWDWDKIAAWDAGELQSWGFDAETLGRWDDNAANLREMIAAEEEAPTEDPGAQIDRAEELREKWGVEVGQLWRLGEHTVICGDCRESETWARLLSAAGVDKVNGVFTSPPYAEQRKEQYGGVPADEYVDWWEAVQANVKANLADDGSFFVNIKPHCEDGERVLYVFDLVLAMRRRWGWRFVDELCWNNTKAGVPGTWPNRLKNAFEPVYHFSANGRIAFFPKQAGEVTDGAFDYHPLNQKSTTDTPFTGAHKHLGYHKGVSLPSNVIDAPAEGAGIHQAPFPVELPAFAVRAYSDAGDVWVDPFLGSGTTIVAAHQNGRRGLGIEALPKYVAVTLQRWADMTGGTPVRESAEG